MGPKRINGYCAGMTGYIKTLGPKHPRTLQSISDLPCVYCEQGRTELVTVLAAKTLAGSKKLVGLEHIQTLNAMVFRRRLIQLAEQFLTGLNYCEGASLFETMSALRLTTNLSHVYEAKQANTPAENASASSCWVRRANRFRQTYYLGHYQASERGSSNDGRTRDLGREPGRRRVMLPIKHGS